MVFSCIGTTYFDELSLDDIMAQNYSGVTHVVVKYEEICSPFSRVHRIRSVRLMSTSSVRPAGKKSRQQVNLMLEMTRLLRAHGFKINVIAPDLCEQLLKLSATVKDVVVAETRAQLLGVVSPDNVEAVVPTPEKATQSKRAVSFLTAPEETALQEPLEVAIVEPAKSAVSEPDDSPPPHAEPKAEALPSQPNVPSLVELFPHDICDGSFTCPSCQRVLPMPRVWPQVRNAKALACPCEQRFWLRPDTRRFPRKRVHCLGYYLDTATNSSPTDIVIKDLSFGGMQFQVKEDHTLHVGMQLQVYFALLDEDSRKIQQTIYVQSVKRGTIGAQWDEKAPFDPALALFLMQ